MPQSAVTHPDIPDRLRSAKETAVTRLLCTSRVLPRLTALAASTHPDHNVVGVGIGVKITSG